MSGIFVNRGITKIEERMDQKSKEVRILWYTGGNMQNRDIRKFVEVIYRNFEYLTDVDILSHSRKEIIKVLTSPTAIILVAVLDNTMIGYLIADLVVYNNRTLMHIYYIYTGPAYRSKGVATFLLNQVQDYADVYNCSALSLTHDTYKRDLTKFYISNGFTYDPSIRSHMRYDMLVKFI